MKVFVIHDMFNTSKIEGVFNDEQKAINTAMELAEKNTGRRDSYDLRYEITGYEVE